MKPVNKSIKYTQLILNTKEQIHKKHIKYKYKLINIRNKPKIQTETLLNKGFYLADMVHIQRLLELHRLQQCCTWVHHPPNQNWPIVYRVELVA